MATSKKPFNPSLTGSASDGIFGLPYTADESFLHLLPIPWEVTTSYGAGTSQGPETILNASPQIDLFDIEFGKAFEAGYYMHPISSDIMSLNERLKPLALKVRTELEEKGKLSAAGEKKLDEVNKGCAQMVDWVHGQTSRLLEEGRCVGLIGGDHSSPEGALRAIAESQKEEWGVLHVDAHADLRDAYQGFKHSHASIMYNVMNAPWKPKTLVQVGIRDFCEEEYRLTQERKDIQTFYDTHLKSALFKGKTWDAQCLEIIDALPSLVYVSFDIDGLSPHLCPGTGTPVPGGLSFEQANFLLGTLATSGRKIIGFDLNEVAPGQDPDDEWNGNVGARLLYKLCGWTVLSQKGRRS